MDERRGYVTGNIFGLLKVNSVKVKFGGHIKDGLDKRGAVRGGDCRREIAGASPSADGDTRHRTMLLSLLDKRGNVGNIGGVNGQDSGIRGGQAKNGYERLAEQVKRTTVNERTRRRK